MVIALPVVAGIAMIRHHLYDVDLVLNRTLVYGALSACVIGAYAALVLGVGAIASGQGTVVAAAAAARLRARRRAAAQPPAARRQPAALRRARRAASRPSPTSAGASRRRSSPAPCCRRSSRPSRARCGCPTRRSSSRRPTASSPGAQVGEPRGLPLEIPLLAPGRGGRAAAAVAAPRRRGAVAAPTGNVLEMLARQAGVAVQAVRLHADLQRSREQLVTAREEERRRLRRDLHDGLGPTLAGDRDAARGRRLAARTSPRRCASCSPASSSRRCRRSPTSAASSTTCARPRSTSSGWSRRCASRGAASRSLRVDRRGRRALRRPAGRASRSPPTGSRRRR